MNMMIFAALIGMIAGSLLLLGISPTKLIQNGSNALKKNDQTIRAKVIAATNKKKKKGLGELIKETKVILKATNKEGAFATIIILSFALMVLGAFIAVALDNLLLLPVLAIGFALLPFWYVKFTAIRWKKELNNELETALSIITTSYLRSDSIITAIDENINYINPPVYDVFKAFLTQTKLINSNIKIALANLKPRIDSSVFHEWVDAVIDCQEDKNLKSVLTPIVSKLSDMRIVSAEVDYLLYEPVKEFTSMAILLVGNIPLMYFLNKDWFHALLFTLLGKVVLAICGLALFVSLAAVVRLTKPVEYRR